MFRKGIFVWFGEPLSKVDMDKRFELIKNAGFDSVMIWWEDTDDGVSVKRTDYRPLADKHGLYIENAHLPFEEANNIWLPSSIGEDYALSICNQIRECWEFKIPTVVMHLSKGKNPPPYNEVGLHRLKKIVAAAEKYNVNIAFENLRYVEYLDFVFQNIQSDKIGFCYDSGHNNCYTPEIDVFEKYKNKLLALHLNDNIGNDDDMHMLPFDGTANWDKIIKTLKDIEYKGVLSLEVQQDKHIKYMNLSGEEYLALAFEKVKKIEELLNGKILHNVSF